MSLTSYVAMDVDVSKPGKLNPFELPRYHPGNFLVLMNRSKNLKQSVKSNILNRVVILVAVDLNH